MPGWARPVRILLNSLLNESTVLSIFCSRDFLMSAMLMKCSGSHVDQGAFILAHHHTLEVAGLEDGKHLEGQILVAAQRKRCRVQHLEILDQGFIEGDGA